ncbi:FAD-dependent monooxygenase [Streptomyces sp. NPDC094038]|uniref:FAD-dependent monooxygenase n=1 Tax=Streptomyces sp. NPDC094038 TaxID=3366055 RepID=UPI0037F73822
METDVLIIGAGLSGTALAAQCRALGLRTHLVEQSGEPRATGAGIMLHPNALECLTDLGTRIPDAGRFIEHQTVRDAEGRSGTLSWSEVWPSGALPLAIDRRVLSELIIDHLGPGAVSWGLRPIGYEQDAEAVRVELSDGSVHRCRLLVGADGINSWVRRRIDPATDPRPLGQTFWRTTVAEEAPFDFAEWRVWRGSGHFFGGMPIGGGRMHVFVQSSVADPGRTDQSSVRADMAALVAEIGTEAHRTFRELRLDRDVDVRTVHGLLASRWTDGRVAIIGDAAHAVSPATTQGGGLALGDAVALAEHLALYGAGPDALARFANTRRPQVVRFVRRARLHAELITAVQNGQGVHEGAAPADAVEWFRRLYQPLLASA